MLDCVDQRFGARGSRKGGYLPAYRPVRKKHLAANHRYAHTNRQVEEHIFFKVLSERAATDRQWQRAATALLAVLNEEEASDDTPD